ncbi:MAG: glycosyltransferase [Burkholderiales bacterium]|nr:glycosyltransferase [Burkholderiales bacterium]
MSVIIPCWCCADTVARAVDSALRQTRPPAEIILIDDASPDGGATRNALHALTERDTSPTRIDVVVLEANSGPGGARNAGWAQATQRYIAFLDADDIWHPHKLELQIGWMESHPSVSMTGHRSAVMPLGGWPEPPGKIAATRVTLSQMLISNRFPTRSVAMRTDVPVRFKGRNMAEDYLLWLELVAERYECWHLDAVLAFSLRPDFDAGGYSGRLWAHELRELCALAELRRQKRINAISSWVASGWSLAKYIRRLLLRVLRRA